MMLLDITYQIDRACVRSSAVVWDSLRGSEKQNSVIRRFAVH